VAPFELHGSLQCGTAQRQGAMQADSWRNVRCNSFDGRKGACVWFRQTL
jgi:hypothetical protein